jgi:CBS domain-containing protein
MAIADVMTTDLPQVAPRDSLGEVARQMKGRGVKALPVCEQDQLVGIITDWDLAMAIADDKTPVDCVAGDCMTGDIVTADPRATFSEALELMGEHHIHHLLVSEQGRFAGMLHMDVEWEQFDNSVQAPMATFTGRI